MKAILDTNVLIGIYHSRSATRTVLDNAGITSFAITTVTYVEFLGGAKTRFKQDSHKFLKQFPIIPFSSKTQAIAEILGRKTELKKGGSADLLIAAIAKEKGLPVFTANLKDFRPYEIKLIKYTPDY